MRLQRSWLRMSCVAAAGDRGRSLPGAGAGLSDQAGHVHHARRRRQQPGRGHAHRRRQADADVEAADRGAQPARRRRPDRGAGRRRQLEKDGYTLYMTQASTFTVLPIMQEGKMPVDLQKAFVPIGMVGEQPIARRGQQGRAGEQRRGADRARQQDAGRHAVRRHQPRRPVASDRRAVPRPLQGQHLLRARGRRGRVAQRRDRRAHPDHVRGPGRPGAGHPGRRRAGCSASRRRSACPICRTCRPSTRPCRAWCRAAGSC